MGSDNTTSPLDQETDMVIKEAFAVSHGEAVSIMEEGLSAQTLAESYESYVQKYQSTWMADWTESIDAFESEVEDWQETVLQNFIQAANKAAANLASQTGGATPSSSAAEPTNTPPTSKK